jgi:hypothetical protein
MNNIKIMSSATLASVSYSTCVTYPISLLRKMIAEMGIAGTGKDHLSMP